MPRCSQPERTIGLLAARQNGVVTYRGLLALGLTDEQILNRISRGLLIRVFQGVYVVGVPLIDHDALTRAALLTSDRPGTLIGRSAAERHGWLPPRTGYVTIGRSKAPGRRKFRTLEPLLDGGAGWVDVRQAGRLAHDTTTSAGWPITTAARALVDLAGSWSRWFEEGWRQAEYRGAIDPVEIRSIMGSARRKGNSLVRAKLADYLPVDLGDYGLDSPFELDAIKMVLAAGVPHPLANHWIRAGGRRRRLDMFFDAARLAVEIDGWNGHNGPEAFEDDRLRDSDLLEIGILTQRFSVKRCQREPHRCAQLILQQIEERTR